MLRPTSRGYYAGSTGQSEDHVEKERVMSKKERAKQLKAMLSMTDDDRSEHRTDALSPPTKKQQGRKTHNDG